MQHATRDWRMGNGEFWPPSKDMTTSRNPKLLPHIPAEFLFPGSTPAPTVCLGLPPSTPRVQPFAPENMARPRSRPQALPICVPTVPIPWMCLLTRTRIRADTIGVDLRMQKSKCVDSEPTRTADRMTLIGRAIIEITTGLERRARLCVSVSLRQRECGTILLQSHNVSVSVAQVTP